ncbi:response regulator [Geomonas edaphica]|uniref:response regulator n=1 Tax=Geomonas edaphica TaxID=2570226 RepID=UPI0010A8F0BF|nr:response regulator [Geomonas edaphica]
MMLAKQGYQVLPATSPKEAMELARNHQGKISLLITDVIMPEMNGQELAGLLLAGNPELRCLFISGYTADLIAHHGVLDEGVHFVQKPFSIPELAAKVREALA